MTNEHTATESEKSQGTASSVKKKSILGILLHLPLPLRGVLLQRHRVAEKIYIKKFREVSS